MSWCVRILNRLTFFVPPRKKLGWLAFLQTIHADWEPEWTHLEVCLLKLKIGRSLAVDVGANCGLYSIKLASLFSRVHSFEPNPKVVKFLKDADCENVTIHQTALSSKKSEIDLRIPSKGKQVLSSWASFNKNNCEDADGFFCLETEAQDLDGFGFEQLDFIKIDVEGHEIEVLEGAKKTILKCRPILLVKIKDANIEKADDFFKAMNYLKVQLGDLIGKPGSRENYFFIPSEKTSNGAAN